MQDVRFETGEGDGDEMGNNDGDENGEFQLSIELKTKHLQSLEGIPSISPASDRQTGSP